MRYRISTAAALLIVVGLTANAQAPAPAAPGRAAAAPPPAGIDLVTAKRMAAATEAAAKAAGASVAIAIVDMNGDLVYFQRMDGTNPRAVTFSHGKARAALLFGLPTKTVQDAVAAGKPVPAMVTLPAAGANEMTVLQGGLPILKDGKVVAAIGVGGSTSAADEKFAQAGLDVYAQ